WGDKDTVGVLVDIVRKDTDVFVQRAAIDALGELKAESAAGVIVEAFINFHLRGNATEALKKIGPPAEKAVQQLLNSGDVFIRKEALELLREVGTRDSIPVVQLLLRRDKHPFVQQAGAETLAILTKLPPKKDDKKKP